MQFRAGLCLAVQPTGVGNVTTDENKVTAQQETADRLGHKSSDLHDKVTWVEGCS